MISHDVIRRGAPIACLLLITLLCACEGEEEVPVAVAPPPRFVPPPAPPPPTIKTVEDLMIELNIDQRIFLEERMAPGPEDERIAVLEFFDAFARGDDMSVKRMMSVLDQRELEQLVASGVWEESIAAIEEIELQTGVNEDGDKCVLGIFIVGSREQLQMWYYSGAENDFTFQSVAAPPNLGARLSGEDWIAAWHEILAEEMALAEKPDEDLDMSQANYDESDGNGAGGTPSAPSTTPSLAPGGPGGGRRPTPPPRKPPGPGGP